VNPLATNESTNDQAAPAGSDARRLQKLRLTVAIFWTLSIMALCWLSPKWVHELERRSQSLFDLPDLDKVVHWGIFCAFALLWLRTSTSRWRFWLVALGGLVLATITELVQNLPIVDRDGNLPDAAADMIGVLIGLAIAVPIEPVARAVESRLFRKWITRRP
jgi:hypothetical protein